MGILFAGTLFYPLEQICLLAAGQLLRSIARRVTGTVPLHNVKADHASFILGHLPCITQSDCARNCMSQPAIVQDALGRKAQALSARAGSLLSALKPSEAWLQSGNAVLAIACIVNSPSMNNALGVRN